MGKLVDLKSVINLVEVEPEVPGPIPDNIWNLIKDDRKKAENLFRTLVRTTKTNIVKRIKSVYGE